MSIAFPNAAARMARLQRGLRNNLKDTNMDIMLPERESKKIVEYMVAALEPTDLR